MAVDFTIKQDDTLPEIQATLLDSSTPAQPVGLGGCSVRFIMTNKATLQVQVDEPAEIVDAGLGVVKYVWQPNDTSVAGTFNGEFEVEFPDLRLETFPNDKYIQIKVKPDLGGIQ